MNCLLQTPGIREPLRGAVRTVKTADVEEEPVTPDNTVECEDVDASVTRTLSIASDMSPTSDMSPSLTCGMSGVEHTSSGPLDRRSSTPLTRPVVQLHERHVTDTATPGSKHEGTTLNVCQSSHSVLQRTQTDVSQSSPVDVEPSNFVAATQQPSRPPLTMVVSSGGRRIVVPVAQKRAAHITVSRTAPVTGNQVTSSVCSQQACGYLQPQQTSAELIQLQQSAQSDTSHQAVLAYTVAQSVLVDIAPRKVLADTVAQSVIMSPASQQLSIVSVAGHEVLPVMTGNEEVMQYFTAAVLPDYVEYNAQQPVQEQQHR